MLRANNAESPEESTEGKSFDGLTGESNSKTLFPFQTYKYTLTESPMMWMANLYGQLRI